MEKRFNVRIYGWLEVDGKLLIIKEPFMGENIRKFPGGGLEFGEGTHDCLKREFKEELNLDIEVKEHIYTQDFFLQSALKAHEQILMIYYRVEALDMSQFQQKDTQIEELIWIDLDELRTDDLSLPTDRLVVQLMKNQMK